ncbi:hypothetical protein, partial [Sphingomonas sp. CFBP 13706]|uniref:hypothetical protein n=1 Tax=Sphingomonas sp. CFBP 13706 TaxID=2775314 RepID=UPI001A7EB88B
NIPWAEIYGNPQTRFPHSLPDFRNSRTAHPFVTVDADRRGLSALHAIRLSVVKHLFFAQW